MATRGAIPAPTYVYLHAGSGGGGTRALWVPGRARRAIRPQLLGTFSSDSDQQLINLRRNHSKAAAPRALTSRLDSLMMFPAVAYLGARRRTLVAVEGCVCVWERVCLSLCVWTPSPAISLSLSAARQMHLYRESIPHTHLPIPADVTRFSRVGVLECCWLGCCCGFPAYCYLLSYTGRGNSFVLIGAGASEASSFYLCVVHAKRGPPTCEVLCSLPTAGDRRRDNKTLWPTLGRGRLKLQWSSRCAAQWSDCASLP